MDSKLNWKNSKLLRAFAVLSVAFWILTIIFIGLIYSIDSLPSKRIIICIYLVITTMCNIIASLYIYANIHDAQIVLRLVKSVLQNKEPEIPHNIWQKQLKLIANMIYSQAKKVQDEKNLIRLKQQKKIEEQKELLLSKQVLANNLNHEIKTPIGIIQGYIDTLIDHDDEIPPEMRRQFLRKCLDNTQRLQNIAYNISLITRIENGREAIQMYSVNLTEEVSSIADDLTPILEKHSIRFINRLPDTMIVHSNKNVIYGIFSNLIKNAAFYSGGTTIVVEIIDRKHLSFRDNGKGVAPEYLQKIFERFYRIDLDKKRNLSSSGLGLSIVKESVELCGWKISAHNYQAGGLQFIITL